MIHKFFVPLKSGDVRRQHDHYNPNAERTDWNPTVNREIMESLFAVEDLGRHNVRVGKETGVMREVYETITQEPTTFWKLHNGFVIIADAKCVVKRQNPSTGQVEDFLEFTINTDNGPQGFANGNSSRGMFVVANNDFDLISKIERGEHVAPQVHFEVWTGLTREEMTAVSAKRNEQYAVSESSVLNHEGKYDMIKAALRQDWPGFNAKIAYKMNESGFPIDNVTQLLMAMNFIAYPGGDEHLHPQQAQNSRTIPRRHFIDDHNQDAMKALMSVIGDILILHDMIRLEFMDMYRANSSGRGYRYPNTKEFGDNTGIREPLKRPKALPFVDANAAYDTPLSLSIPMLAAFRQLLEMHDDGRAYWAVDGGFDGVLALWHQVGPTLTKKVVERCYVAKKNLAMAQDSDNWDKFYDIIATVVDTTRPKVLTPA